MGTLAISAANLNTIENNMLSLNENINSVTGDIVNINGQINSVTNQISDVKSTVTSLEDEIKAFMKEVRGTTVVANAQNDILLKENEFNKKFGNYGIIRNNLKGIIDSVNLNIVSKKTLKNESEKIIYNAPKYFLSYTLLAISCWFNNDRSGADKALREALKLDDNKTSLLLALVHTKLGRVGTSYKWIKRYMGRQDPTMLSSDFCVLLDAYAEGVFDSTINELIKSELNRYTSELNLNGEILENETRRFKEFFLQSKQECPNALDFARKFTDNYQNLSDVINNSHSYMNAYEDFDELVHNSNYSQAKTIDDFINDLIYLADKEEASLQRNILKDKLIIKYEGDVKKVDAEYENNRLSYETETNLYTLLSNMIFDYKDSAESTKQMAVSYLKKVIKNGLDEAIPLDLMNNTNISINDFKGSTTNGSNEKALLDAMREVVKKPFDLRMNQVTVVNPITIASFGSVVVGFVVAFSWDLLIAAVCILIGIALFIYGLSKNNKEKEAIKAEFDAAFHQYEYALLNTLSEVVDIFFLQKRAKSNYDYIINYLDSFNVR